MATKNDNTKHQNTAFPRVSNCNSTPSNGLEKHRVETEDGYILSLFRLKNVRKCPIEKEDCRAPRSGESHPEVFREEPKKFIPVLIITGLFNNGTEWLLFDNEEQILPSVLMNEGYDCWMGCVRGSPDSKEHKTLKTNSKEFWDFSMDEMSKFDIPAMIDYILKVTERKDLFYLGLSMGAATILATLCVRPEYSSKVRAVVALAPGVYGHDFKNPLIKSGVPILARLPWSRFLFCRSIFRKSTITVIVKRFIPSFTKINRENLAGYCLKLIAQMVGLIASTGSSTIPQEMFSRMAKLLPASTSIKYVTHVAQMFSAKRFQMFNYGGEENMKRYGNLVPPLYNLGQVSVPVATFTAEHDNIIPASNVLRTSEELPNLISHTHISTENFGHWDFIFGNNLNVLLYPAIIQILKQYST